MKKTTCKLHILFYALTACGFVATAQMPAQTDSSTIAPDGTAYVTRIVPVPKTVSPEAQKWLASPASDKAGPESSIADQRRGVDGWEASAGAEFRKRYPVDVQAATIAGVPVSEITPPDIPAAHRNWVLINLHGGGFKVDSGSLTETVPVAALTHTKVVAVLYRLSPEVHFPAAVDDAITAYRELLKTHKPSEMVIFGTSAGAVLTGEVAVKLKQLGLPQPAALGIFSGEGDFSIAGDSLSLYALNGFSGHLDPPKSPPSGLDEYVSSGTSLQDPVLSPVYADLHGLPPTLFMTSGRDLLLSGTTILHRKFLGAGVDARLVVFDALPHAFWNTPQLPETREAHEIMADFFVKQLMKASSR